MQDEPITVRSLRHLDALVAEHVMGIQPPTRPGINFTPAKYTTWPGLEPVIRNREEAGLRWDISGPSGGKYWAIIFPQDAVAFDDHPDYSGDASTVPVAYNVAALASAGCRVRLELDD